MVEQKQETKMIGRTELIFAKILKIGAIIFFIFGFFLVFSPTKSLAGYWCTGSSDSCGSWECPQPNPCDQKGASCTPEQAVARCPVACEYVWGQHSECSGNKCSALVTNSAGNCSNLCTKDTDCGGSGTTCSDINDACFGATACCGTGTCGGAGSCAYSDGSCHVLDSCGVCGGNGSTCKSCTNNTCVSDTKGPYYESCPSSCGPSAINGVCGSSVGTCNTPAAATSVNVPAQTWTCPGSGGGTDASCSINTPIDCSCGSTSSSCSSGCNVQSGAGGTWDCISPNSGKNATGCTVACSTKVDSQLSYGACNAQACSTGTQSVSCTGASCGGDITCGGVCPNGVCPASVPCNGAGQLDACGNLCGGVTSVGTCAVAEDPSQECTNVPLLGKDNCGFCNLQPKVYGTKDCSSPQPTCTCNTIDPSTVACGQSQTETNTCGKTCGTVVGTKDCPATCTCNTIDPSTVACNQSQTETDSCGKTCGTVVGTKDCGTCPQGYDVCGVCGGDGSTCGSCDDGNSCTIDSGSPPNCVHTPNPQDAYWSGCGSTATPIGATCGGNPDPGPQPVCTNYSCAANGCQPDTTCTLGSPGCFGTNNSNCSNTCAPPSSEPAIAFSQTFFIFSSQVNVAPSGQNLLIMNTGPVDGLTWAVNPLPNQPWCHVLGGSSPIIKGGFTNVTISVDALPSSRSQPNCIFYISSNASNNPSQLMTVQYTVGSAGPPTTYYSCQGSSPTTCKVSASCSAPGNGCFAGDVNCGGTCGGGSGVSPTPPGGGPSCNTNTCGGAGPPACGIVRLSWTDNSTNETGFKIYMDGTFTGHIAPGSSPPSATGGTLTYDFIPLDGNPHNYSVAATNGALDSAQVAATNNSFSSVSCAPNLSDSDKDIVAINGQQLYNNQPNGNICDATTDVLPKNTPLNYGDTVKFSLNLCNDTGHSPASNLTVTDNMTNLIAPKTGWNVQYNGTALTQGAGPNQYSISGTAPNQTMTVNLSGQILAAGAASNLTYEATLTVPAGTGGNIGFFQNSFKVNYNVGAVSPLFNTPFLRFNLGKSSAPILQEVN